MIFRKSRDDDWDYVELIPESLLDKVCLKLINDHRISIHASQKRAYEIMMEYFNECYGIGEADGIAYGEDHPVCGVCCERDEKGIDWKCNVCLAKESEHENE